MPVNKRKKKALQRQDINRGPTQEERRRQSVNTREIGGGGPPPGYNSRRSEDYGTTRTNPWLRRLYIVMAIIMIAALIIPLFSGCFSQQVIQTAKAADIATSSVAPDAKTVSSYSRARYLRRDEAESPPTATLPAPTNSLPETTLYIGETGHYLKDAFLTFWRSKGGKAAFGNPISEEFEQNGRVVQYFEKALLEYHPEEKGTKNEVQMAFLGRQLADAKGYTFTPNPDTTSTATRTYFPQTGQAISGSFKPFWEKNNGLSMLGYPISGEFTENGLIVQYFERGRLEILPGSIPLQISNSGDLLLEARGWPRPLKLPLELNIDDTEIYQGRTLSIRLDNGGLWLPDNLKGSIGSTNLRFFKVGAAFKAFNPVPVDLEAKSYPFKITFTDLAGRERLISQAISIVKFNFPTQRLYIPPEKSDTLDPAAEEAENKILAPIYNTYSSLPLWSGLWGLPSPNAVPSAITTEFGQRRAYNDSPNYTVYHGGIDYAESEGTPVFASATGKVVYTGSLKVRGNTVIIDHGMGILSLYFHLSQIGVKVGQEIKGGSVIGRVGTTGRSDGPHLHWEVRVNGIITDPRLFQKQDLSR